MSVGTNDSEEIWVKNAAQEINLWLDKTNRGVKFKIDMVIMCKLAHTNKIFIYGGNVQKIFQIESDMWFSMWGKSEPNNYKQTLSIP